MKVLTHESFKREGHYIKAGTTVFREMQEILTISILKTIIPVFLKMKYQIVAGGNIQDTNTSPKYCTGPVYSDMTDLKHICDISGKPSLTAGDAISILFRLIAGLIKRSEDGLITTQVIQDAFRPGGHNPTKLNAATTNRGK